MKRLLRTPLRYIGFEVQYQPNGRKLHVPILASGMRQMKGLVRASLRYAGFELMRIPHHEIPSDKYRFPPDFSESEIETCLRVRPFTMTSMEKIVTAIRAAEYVALNRIPGAIVECGIWRGGSMMAMALTLLKLGKGDIPLYLFDTFEGMSEPTEADGKVAYENWKANQTSTHNNWNFASLSDVQSNVYSTGYDRRLLFFIKGKVEDTIPSAAPEEIALLRLDTDWYESTKHNLEHLFPRLSHGGVLIIDDYGCWGGCQRAVDQYLQGNQLGLFLNRIDYSGRIAVKF